MLMDLMDDCKISHLEVHCSGRILCEVDLSKAIEYPISMGNLRHARPWGLAQNSEK